MKKRAVAYFRTSSLTNVKKKGDEFKDSLDRQQQAVKQYADSNDYEILTSAYDAGLTGEASIASRDGIKKLIDYCYTHMIDTILCENAGRFARNKDVAIKGMYYLEEIGIHNIIFCDKSMNFPKVWKESELEAIMPFLEISFAEKEKRETVKKLKEARDRKKEQMIYLTLELKGKCEGQKSYAETNPELVREAKRLRRANPITGKKLSFRKISTKLAESGYFDSWGKQLDHGTGRKICMQGPAVKALSHQENSLKSKFPKSISFNVNSEDAFAKGRKSKLNTPKSPKPEEALFQYPQKME